jgi:hypothetical protein
MVSEKEDLGLKIGTERQAFLEKVKKNLEQQQLDMELTLKLNEINLKHIDKEIALEKEKLK